MNNDVEHEKERKRRKEKKKKEMMKREMSCQASFLVRQSVRLPVWASAFRTVSLRASVTTNPDFEKSPFLARCHQKAKRPAMIMT